MLPQPGVLLGNQVNHQGGMTMDQGQKTGPVQTDERKRCQRFCIAAVRLIGGDEVFVKKQLTRAITNAVARAAAQLNQPFLHNMNGLDRFTAPEHQGTRWKGQTVAFGMLTNQLERFQGLGRSTQPLKQGQDLMLNQRHWANCGVDHNNTLLCRILKLA